MSPRKQQHEFHGGVHPAYRKELSMEAAVQALPTPQLLRISTSQHLGAPAKPVVSKGDTVQRGQLIAEAAGFISACVHSPVSGKVAKIEPAPTPQGMLAPAIEIQPDGKHSTAEPLSPIPDWRNAGPKDLVARVADAGITGMGGAGFPTHVKLSPPPEKTIHTVIINGAECEPYLTADYRLMLENTGQLVEGAEIIRYTLGAKKTFIAIEDNKPEAIALLEKALKEHDAPIEIVALETKYPQGAEKQQILAITGQEVPSGGLPMDVGVIVENVGTTIAVRNAVLEGRPLMERVVTVTGTPVKRPSNILAPLGALYSDLLAACDGAGACTKVISGGPMMGFAVASLDFSVTKTTSGLLFLAPEQISQYTSMPCISCGRCIQACPSNLMPSELSQMLEAEDYEGAAAYSVMDCIECGCCAYVCPAHRPMVQHMRRGKAWVAQQRRAQQAKAAKTDSK